VCKNFWGHFDEPGRFGFEKDWGVEEIRGGELEKGGALGKRTNEREPGDSRECEKSTETENY